MGQAILTKEQITELLHQKRSLTKDVYDYLIKKLMHQELVPGQIINRRQISTQLGISVAPVLEAMLQLESEGFLESVPRKGTIIRPVGIKDCYAQMMIREGLEVVATEHYYGEKVRQNYDELLEYANYMDKLSVEGLNAELVHIEADIVFHASLVNLCNLECLTSNFLKNVRAGFFFNLSKFYKPVGYIPSSHVELLDNLVIDDVENARAVIKEHIWKGRRSYTPF